MKKEKRPKDSPWIAWLALVIAIFGGVPGLITTLDYFKRTGLQINYDAKDIPMNNRKRAGCYNVSAVTIAVEKMAERAYVSESNYTKMGSVGVYIIKRM
jgi:hypothetical protein